MSLKKKGGGQPRAGRPNRDSTLNHHVFERTPFVGRHCCGFFFSPPSGGRGKGSLSFHTERRLEYPVLISSEKVYHSGCGLGKSGHL